MRDNSLLVRWAGGLDFAALVTAAVLLASAPALTAGESTYDFNAAGLHPGALASQDHWQNRQGESLISVSEVTGAFGPPTRLVALAAGPVATSSRLNAPPFGYRLTGNETEAVFEFDTLALGTALLALGRDFDDAIPHSEYGFTFGITHQTLLFMRAGWDGGFSMGPDDPFESRLSPNDWVTVRLTADLTAHGGDGLGTVSLRNNSRGEMTFTAHHDLSNLPLGLNGMAPGAQPANWNGVYLRLENGGMIARLTLPLSPGNRPPNANSQSVTTPEDTAIAIVLTGSDADGDALTYTVFTPPQHGSLAGAGPTLTYTPTTDYHGSESFTFKVNDGTADSATATVSITVTPENDSPQASELTVNITPPSGAIELTATDPDGDVLAFAVVTPPQFGTLTGTAPSLTYQSAPGQPADEFEFEVTDPHGAKSRASVRIQVLEQIRLDPTSASVLPGSVVAFAVSGGVPPFTFTLEANQSGATLGANGTYTAGPAPGTDTVRVTDGAGAGASATVVVRDCAHLAYEASLNSLPSAQGWRHQTTGPGEANYSLVGGILVQGSTDLPEHYQYYQSAGVDFDFTVHTVVAEASVRINWSGLVPPGQDYPRAGWGLELTDATGRTVMLYVASGGFFLLGRNDQASPFIVFDTTTDFHNFRLVVNRDGATAFRDGMPAASLEFSQLRLDLSHLANSLIIGDLTVSASSSSQVRWFRLAASCVPDRIHITPNAVSVRAGDSVLFTAGGGQPPFTFTLESNQSGATLHASGAYTAGPNPGTDTVRVTDGAGATATATATVTVLGCEPLADLLGWWRGEGNALDSLGQSPGTPQQGATFAPGHQGQAFQLDGLDDYVEIPATPRLTVSGAFTVAAWVQPNTASASGTVITKYNSARGQASWGLLLVEGGLQLYASGDGALAGAQWAQSAPNLVPANAWTHVAGAFDATRQEWRLYINGREVPSTLGREAIVSAVFDSPEPVRLGTFVDQNGNYASRFGGRLDEVLLYARALTPDEILAVSEGCRSAPPLAIQVDPQTGEVTLSWPLPADGWVMEWAPDLGPTGTPTWTVLPPPYTATATHLLVKVPATEAQRFFRLRPAGR